MSLKNDVMCLGLGNCGCKQAKVFHEMGYSTMYANGSVQDLKLLGNIPNVFHLKNFDGFGGHRERALDCLATNEDFMEAIQTIKEKIIFVFYGSGGSTGSGCSTVCEEILIEITDEEGNPEKIICPVPTLPSLEEPIAKHRNAYQAVQELQELERLGATFFINNNVSTDYNYINTTFAKMLNNFITNDSYGEINNFDESEHIEMLSQSGAMVMSLFGKDKIDKAVMLDKLTKSGIFAPLETDKTCGNIAIIHSGKDSYDIDLSSVIAEVGKPFNVFEGYNGRSTMVAVSGCSYPVSHIMKLGEMAKKAVEERNRSRQNTQKLASLDFIGEEEAKTTPVASQKKPSKLEMMRQRQAKMGK